MEIETLIDRFRLNVAYKNGYKLKLSWIDSPDCLASGCYQTIEHIFSCFAIYFEGPQHLKNTLKLLSIAKYSVAKILGPWRTPGGQ